MSMYGRIQPDHLGRPNSLWISAHALEVIGGGLFRIDVKDGKLLLIPDPEGKRFNRKTRVMVVGAKLDALNKDGELSNLPFAITRRLNGEQVYYEMNPRETDVNLSTRATGRETAMPMKIAEQSILPNQGLTQPELIRAFALATVARGGDPITDGDMKTPDDLLAKLPGFDVVLRRFGTWARFRAFVDFQVQRLKRARMTQNEAYEALMAVLEGEPGETQ